MDVREQGISLLWLRILSCTQRGRANRAKLALNQLIRQCKKMERIKHKEAR